MMRVLFALAASVALTACGASRDDSTGDDATNEVPTPTLPPPVPLPECPDADYSTCDVRHADCQKRLFELAACMRKNEPLTNISIQLMTPDQYVEVLRQDYEGVTEPAITHFDAALSLFGLAPKQMPTLEQNLQASVVDLLGVYRGKEKRIVIIDRDEPADTAQIDATLLHEFIHALQDADYDLLSWPDGDTVPSFDARLARNSVIEGEASFYQYRAAVPLLGIDITQVDFASAMREHLDYTRGLVQKSQSPLGESFSTFPYGFGAAQAFAAWTDGGPRGTDPLWASPPTSTQQVMSPILGVDTPQTSGLEIPTPDIKDLTSDSDDTLGAWGLDILLERLEGEGKEADADALTWRGDHLWVYTDAQGTSTYLLWQLELASPAAATRLNGAFDSFLGCQHATAGSRVFASCSDFKPAPELTAWGQSWLAAE